MKFQGPMIVVEDMERAKTFYQTLLQRTIILDFGENVTFDGPFSIQQKALWMEFIQVNSASIQGYNNSFELYFEEDDFDGFLARLYATEGICYINDKKNAQESSWGQRAIRFYDPDGNLIEVGENMEVVVRRFLKSGMSPEQVAEKTMYPLPFVQQCSETL